LLISLGLVWVAFELGCPIEWALQRITSYLSSVWLVVGTTGYTRQIKKPWMDWIGSVSKDWIETDMIIAVYRRRSINAVFMRIGFSRWRRIDFQLLACIL